MTAQIVQPVIFDSEKEVDVIRFYPLDDGRVGVVIPIGSKFVTGDGTQKYTAPEIRLLADALYLAAAKADALAMRRAGS